MIRTAAKAGIPAVKYYLCAMENQRTESIPLGRGGSRLSTWDLEKAKNRPQRHAERITADMQWERITYFLKRVIPVATECKVRMACHPCDPWLPPGYRGVDRVLGLETVPRLRRRRRICGRAGRRMNPDSDSRQRFELRYGHRPHLWLGRATTV